MKNGSLINIHEHNAYYVIVATEMPMSVLCFSNCLAFLHACNAYKAIDLALLSPISVYYVVRRYAQGYLYTDTGPLGKYTKRNVLLLKVCQGALQLATANFFASFSVWIGPLFALKKSDENPAVAATEAEHPDNPIHPLVVTHRCPTLFMGLSPQGPSENRSKEAVMSSSPKLFFARKFPEYN